MARRKNALRVDGVLLLDKPTGPGSNAVLQHVKHLYRAERAGHTGTLDPLASGLLPICFGEATKFSADLLEADKGYVAQIQLGQRTATGDAEGPVVESRPVSASPEQVEHVLNTFRGDIEQVPPMYSALKRGGVPLYEMARKGEVVERKPRSVRIIELELRALQGSILSIYVRCSKGTYVRTLAEDIGERLECGAHLSYLRRVEIGLLNVDAATTVEALDAMSPDERQGRLLPPDLLVQSLPRLDLSGDESMRFRNGQKISMSGAVSGALDRVRIYDADRFLGIASIGVDGILSPKRLLRTE